MKSESGIAASDGVREGASIAAYDAVWVASQLGRLDFVSALLVIASLILGAFTASFVLFSFPLFRYFKTRAESEARKAAESVLKDAKEQAIEAAVLQMEKMLPVLVKERGELAISIIAASEADAVTSDQARDIAEAQGDTEETDAAD